MSAIYVPGMAFFKTGVMTGNAFAKVVLALCSLVVLGLGSYYLTIQSRSESLIIISANTNTQKMFPSIITRFKECLDH
jgi:hypothetical protein